MNLVVPGREHFSSVTNRTLIDRNTVDFLRRKKSKEKDRQVNL